MNDDGPAKDFSYVYQTSREHDRRYQETISERATIAQQRADIAALVRYIESCDAYATVQPIIERYRAEGE
jgi:hypothetical protein